MKGWDSTGKLQERMKMADDDMRLTIRMGPEEVQMMEDFMADHDLGNRSDFVRDAVRAYIASVKTGTPGRAEGGIFVRLSEVQLDTLSALVKAGVTVSEEEFVRKCLLDKIVTKDIEAEAIDNAFRAAQMRSSLR